MSSLLKSRGLWPYIKGTSEKNDEDKLRDEEAKHLLYVAMDPLQISATGVSATAHDLWNKIRENHEGAERDLQNNSLADFLGFKYSKGENIIQYCGRYELALGRVSLAGNTVDDNTKIWVFRNSLPKEIKTVVNTWSMANPRGKVSELITQLKIQYHMDKADGKEESIALFSNEPKPQGGAPRYQNNARQPHQRNKTFCTYCKMDNHIWKECRKLKSDNERKKSFAKTKGTGRQNHSGAFIADEPLQNKPSHNMYSWIIDSGATSHMTANKDIILDYDEFDEPHPIILGDGKPVAAYGEGRIPFSTDEFSGTLESVLWVPKLKENLFSVSRAMKQGCEIKFVNSPAEVLFLKDNRLKLRGFKIGRGLFILNLRPTRLSAKPAEQALTGATEEEWHERFAHVAPTSVKELMKSNAVTGLSIQNQKKTCEDCIAGKICRAQHPSRSSIKASEEVAILHIDTCGPFSSESIGGAKYFILATEEYSDYKLIAFVASKSETPNAVKRIITKTELESKRPVKLIHTDNGSEYLNQELYSWLTKRGTLHTTTATYTPEQNGKAERANRTIIEGVRTLLRSSQLPEGLWAEAANTVVYTTNRLLSSKNKSKTRFELFTKEKPDVSNLRKFGQQAIVRIPDHNRPSKWSPKGDKYRFVGYTDRRNTYRLLNEGNNQIIISCDVRFLNEATTGHEETHKPEEATINILENEDEMETHDESPSLLSNLMSSFSQREEPEQTRETEREAQPPPTEEEKSDDETDENSSHESGPALVEDLSEEESAEPTRDTNKRVTRSALRNLKDFVRDNTNLYTPDWFWNNEEQEGARPGAALFTLDNEPRTLKDAEESDEWPKWKRAMDEELDALAKNTTWTLVSRPPNIRPIKNKWVYKVKLDPQGNVERYKARLVAKGYSQIPNVDYKETFAPVASMTTIRLILAIANRLDMETVQFDVKTAFLYGDLDETIYMEYPDGYPNPNNKVCKLNKSLYGLKQAPRQWNLKFDSFLKRFKLNQSSIDKCLYYNESLSLILAIYVDDGLIASKDKPLMNALLKYLKENFELKVMECEAYLGFQVKRNREKRTLSLVQTHYIEKILERFNMKECKPASTPEEVGAKENDEATPLTEEFPFKELVGSLLYLVTCTRPDIAHAVSLASRTANPTTTHWKRLKRILRYLQGTRDVGIHFRWEKNPQLVGYSDADYANDEETRRSNTGWVIMFTNGPIAWRCQRQPIVTLSTTEAEYVSGCELVKELLPLRETMLELKQIREEPTPVYIDNMSAVRIAKDDGGQQRTKHIDVRHKWLNEQQTKKKIDVRHISGEEQPADLLTKPLHKTKFIANRNLLLSTISMLTLITLVTATNLAKTGPLYFKPTLYPFFNGDTEYLIRLTMMNPCYNYFHGMTGNENTDEKLIDECQKNFIDKVANKMKKKCTPTTEEQLVAINKTLHTNGQNEATAMDRMNGKRTKRALPLLIVAVASIVLTGAFTSSSSQTEVNKNNIERLRQYMEEERRLLGAGGETLTAIRNTLQDMSHWPAEFDQRLRDFKHLAGIRDKIAAYLDSAERMFSEYQTTVEAIVQEAEKNRVTSTLRHLTNDPLWKEPAADWSTLYSCHYHTQANNSLTIMLHFNMPRVDSRIKIMEAVPLDFYNATKLPDGKPSICWMKYRGPKHVLVNTTNNCMTEIIEWATEHKSVRSQFCSGKSDELKPSNDLWERDTCSEKIPEIKRRIQDKEVNGLHRIYCFPFNITIETEPSKQCPDHVFELPGKTTYRIANLEHIGAFVSRSIFKADDHNVNHQILSYLKADEYKVKALNLSAIDSSLTNYVTNLNLLPKNIDLLNAPLGSITSFFGRIKSYLETIGIVLGVIAGIAALVIIAPIIEILFLGFKLLKSGVTCWFASTNRVFETIGIKAKAPLRRKRRTRGSWSDEEKLI